MTDIRPNSFQGCSSLESITIPDSVTMIWGSAFAFCRSLNQSPSLIRWGVLELVPLQNVALWRALPFLMGWLKLATKPLNIAALWKTSRSLLQWHALGSAICILPFSKIHRHAWFADSYWGQSFCKMQLFRELLYVRFGHKDWCGCLWTLQLFEKHQASRLDQGYPRQAFFRMHIFRTSNHTSFSEKDWTGCFCRVQWFQKHIITRFGE